MADTDLYPTPNRIKLLRAVDTFVVWQSSNHESWDLDGFKLTARVTEAERAGWIELGSELEPIGDLGRDGRRWHLTEAGRTILKEHARA